jgi:hypothetical protein
MAKQWCHKLKQRREEIAGNMELLGLRPPRYRPTGDGDVWREEPIDSLIEHGVTSDQVNKLTNHTDAIDTLGDLIDCIGCNLLDSIAGISPESANVIIEALGNFLEKWFSANPAKCPPVHDAADEEDDSE